MVDNCIIILTPTAAKEDEKMLEKAVDLGEPEKWMIDAWIEDTNGILAFVSLNLLARLFIILMKSFKTGLLSATIGAFIIEFYKKLSSDSGDETVDLLKQISQQLTNPRTGTSITAAVDPTFSPSASMIWVNALWLISLVFSLSSALITSLNQQAVRRYIEMSKGDPKKPVYEGRIAQASILEFALESKVSVLGSCVPRLRMLDQFASTFPLLARRLHFSRVCSLRIRMN